MRQDDQGCVQTVLNVNDIQSNSDLISVGEVKIAPSQRLLAYTLETTRGAESYDAHVQEIGGTHNFDQIRTLGTLLD